ncbi:hypothetical protein GH714_011973 [Hevea brasiliensis]|uniref:Pectinesterase inhibitor domain-containing protein n=1 Tax=Hevea brasiliensis TaxID=3981 RepID=A0A6A6LIH6_HEVBR|nr:hypothetical protein GH714_011973 [Hevea brasiliensis]
MTSFSKSTTVLAIVFILVAVLCQVSVEATRVLPEDFATANHLETYSSVYEKAKNTMACWLERLASGPSPRGPASKCSAFWKKMMSFSKSTTVLAIFFILVAVLCQVSVEATRVLPEDFATANHLETYSSVYEKAKNTMACWLERLSSGPSPRGPGH